MKNILSIDVEEFYHRNDFEVSKEDIKKIGNRVEQNVLDILSLLDKYNVKATFFILGVIAEKYPNLVKQIALGGHEIASHGYEHRLVYRMKRNEFIQDLRKSTEILEKIIGKPIYGYRAPSWSIVAKSLWALDIIKDLGFKYDSSIFPFKTFLYGIGDSKIRIWNSKFKIQEVSVSTYCRIPFSGGFYLRITPYFLIRKFIKKLNAKGAYAHIYIDSWEIDNTIPLIQIPLKNKIIPYTGLKNARPKFENLLQDFEFTTIINALGIR